MSIRRISLGLALFAAASAVALLAAEGICRLLPFPMTGRFREAPWMEPDMYRLVPGRGYDHAPNSTPEINGLGMRGPDRPAAKPEGGFRVLVLGDSVAFGVGVEPQETFAAQLEALLRERLPGRPIDVLNGGVVGYNSEQELDFLRERGLPLDPDLVVLAYCPNDTQSTPMVFLEGDRFVFFRPGQPPRSLNSWIYEHSALYRLLNFNVDRVRVVLGGEAAAAGAQDPGGAIDLAANVHALTGMAKLLKARGTPLLGVIFPYLQRPFGEYEDYLRKIHEGARGILERENASVVDLLELWRDVPYQELRLAKPEHDFVHPNARGHRLAALAIDRWMKERGLPR